MARLRHANEQRERLLSGTLRKSRFSVVRAVGIPQSQIDRLEAMQVVPDLMPREHVFDKFEAFRRELPGIIEKIRTSGHCPTASRLYA
jgi:hypothetical protein